MISVYTPPAFKAPVVPSRRWLFGALRDLAAKQFFERLLGQLAPGQLRWSRQPEQWYADVLRVVEQFFPVYEVWLDEFNGLENLLDVGIPVAPQGFHADTYSPALAVIALTTSYASGYFENYQDVAHYECLAEYKFTRSYRPVPGWDLELFLKRFRRAGAETWANLSLPWVVRYVLHETGEAWLDYLDDEETLTNPPWNINELRAHARAWKRARPGLDRVHTFIKYVQANPAKRLPQLYQYLQLGQAPIAND